MRAIRVVSLVALVAGATWSGCDGGTISGGFKPGSSDAGPGGGAGGGAGGGGAGGAHSDGGPDLHVELPDGATNPNGTCDPNHPCAFGDRCVVGRCLPDNGTCTTD